MNSLPKTVTRQRRDCDLNPGPSAPESSTLTTRLPDLGYSMQADPPGTAPISVCVCVCVCSTSCVSRCARRPATTWASRTRARWAPSVSRTRPRVGRCSSVSMPRRCRASATSSRSLTDCRPTSPSQFNSPPVIYTRDRGLCLETARDRNSAVLISVLKHWSRLFSRPINN